jgi:hypothetical protein
MASPSTSSSEGFADFCAAGAGVSSSCVDDVIEATCTAGQPAQKNSGGSRYGSQDGDTTKPRPGHDGTPSVSNGTARACGRK